MSDIAVPNQEYPLPLRISESLPSLTSRDAENMRWTPQPMYAAQDDSSNEDIESLFTDEGPDVLFASENTLFDRNYDDGGKYEAIPTAVCRSRMRRIFQTCFCGDCKSAEDEQEEVDLPTRKRVKMSDED